MKLQTKFFLLLLPMISIPFMITSWVAYTQLKSTAEEKTLSETKTLLDSLGQSLLWRLKTAEANVELFSKSKILEKYLLAEGEERYGLMQPPLLRLFDSYQKVFPHYYEIRILLPDGYEDIRIAQAGITNASEEEVNTNLFKSLKESEKDLFSSFFINPDNQKLSFFAAKKIYLINSVIEPLSAPKKLRGYLAITVDLEKIRNHIKNSRIGKNGFFSLLDNKGTILIHNNSTLHGTSFSQKHFQLILSQKNQDTFKKIFYENEDMLFLAKSLPTEKLVLLMQMPTSEISSAGHRIGIYVLMIALGSVLLIIFTFFIFHRHLIINPIIKLEKAAHRMGKGDLTLRIKPDSNDEVGSLALSLQEMATSLFKSQEQIRKLAFHDPLTGLPNRRMLNDCIEGALSGAKRSGQVMAILFIDIDNFKRINDTFSHVAGDDLLRKIAVRLTEGLRRSDYLLQEQTKRHNDTIARLGGDEFTIVLPNVKEPSGASKVARREMELLSKPFTINGHEISITASIGITLYPHDGDTIPSLIQNADAAMYHAKEMGKNNYQFYAESMNQSVLERLVLENEMRIALERNEFVLYYQPQVQTRSGKITGLEALIRWNHPTKGFLQPEKFISIAEENGMIVAMGEWVIRTACTQLKKWIDQGKPCPTVSVNISSAQFRYQKIHHLLADILTDTGLPARYLEVELTESSIMQSEKSATKMLHAIKEMGVTISLDDFGTGYSSLNYLKRFPIDTIKIDRSFVQDLLADGKGTEIIAAIITLAKSLDLSVVSEGVETKEEFEYLLEKGCDKIQGFYFHKPMPAAEVEKLLLSNCL